jgi:hypothetical protein
MPREETNVQRALEALCEPQELAAALGAILGGVPPDEMMHTIDFMFPALSWPEAAGLVRGMKASAPPQACATLAAHVRQARGEADRPRIEALLP